MAMPSNINGKGQRVHGVNSFSERRMKDCDLALSCTASADDVHLGIELDLDCEDLVFHCFHLLSGSIFHREPPPLPQGRPGSRRLERPRR